MHRLGGHKKINLKTNEFRITCNKSAVILLESGKQRYTKAIVKVASAIFETQVGVLRL